MLKTTGFVISAGFHFVTSHIVTYATDLGIPVTAAAVILTMASLGGMGGRLLAGPITIQLGNKYALLVLIAGEALAMFLFLFARSAWSSYAAAVVFGFGSGAAGPCVWRWCRHYSDYRQSEHYLDWPLSPGRPGASPDPLWPATSMT